MRFGCESQGALFIAECEIYTLFCALTALKCLFGIVYHLGNFRLLKQLKMKNPPSSQTADNSHKPKTLKLN